MADTNKPKCHATFNSFYCKSPLGMLYGGMRKTLFINPHPTSGVSAKNIGIRVDKTFFDLNKQELEFKDAGWRVKANFGGAQLFNLKMKIGEKRKGCVRNNVQFGTDQSNFGSSNAKAKLSVGGMFTLGGAADKRATARVKVFSDEAAEVFVEAQAADVRAACDMRLTLAGTCTGFIGTSYNLPDGFLKNAHVGGLMSIPDMRPALGFFGELPVRSLKRAVVGVEVLDVPQPSAVLFGTQLVLDAETSIIGKACENGMAEVSLVKHFKAADVRMGIEANLVTGSFGKFGAQVTLKV